MTLQLNSQSTYRMVYHIYVSADVANAANVVAWSQGIASAVAASDGGTATVSNVATNPHCRIINLIDGRRWLECAVTVDVASATTSAAIDTGVLQALHDNGLSHTFDPQTLAGQIPDDGSIGETSSYTQELIGDLGVATQANDIVNIGRTLTLVPPSTPNALPPQGIASRAVSTVVSASDQPAEVGTPTPPVVGALIPALDNPLTQLNSALSGFSTYLTVGAIVVGSIVAVGVGVYLFAKLD